MKRIVGSVTVTNLRHDEKLAKQVEDLQGKVAAADRDDLAAFLIKHHATLLKTRELLGKTMSRGDLLAMWGNLEEQGSSRALYDLAGPRAADFFAVARFAKEFRDNIKVIADNVGDEAREITAADIENIDGLTALGEGVEERIKPLLEEAHKVCLGLGSLVMDTLAKEKELLDEAGTKERQKLQANLNNMKGNWFGSSATSKGDKAQAVEEGKAIAEYRKVADQLSVRRAVAVELIDKFIPLTAGHYSKVKDLPGVNLAALQIVGQDKSGRAVKRDFVQRTYGKEITARNLLEADNLNVNWAFVNITKENSGDGCYGLESVAKSLNPARLIWDEEVLPNMSLAAMLNIRVELPLNPPAPGQVAGVGLLSGSAPVEQPAAAAEKPEDGAQHVAKGRVSPAGSE